MKDNNQTITDTLGIFVAVLRKKCLDFTSFQFFNDTDFVSYLQSQLDLVALMLPYLDLLPDDSLQVYLAFNELDSSIYEVLYNYLDHKVFRVVFDYFALAFARLVASFFEQHGNRTVHEETTLYCLKQSLVVAVRFVLREQRIRLDSKLTDIRASVSLQLQSILRQTFKALLKLSYSERARDMLVEATFAACMMAADRSGILLDTLQFVAGNYTDGSLTAQEPYVQSLLQFDFRQHNASCLSRFKSVLVTVVDNLITLCPRLD